MSFLIKKKPKLLVRPKPAEANLSEKVKAKAKELDAKALAREKYRSAKGIVNFDCRDNLAHIDNMAKLYIATFPNGKTREVKGFTVTTLGEPIGTTTVTATRWVKAGMLPEPILVTGRGKIYHIEEAKSFLSVIGEHQQQFRQYRAEHTHITDRLFRENERLRLSLFN